MSDDKSCAASLQCVVWHWRNMAYQRADMNRCRDWEQAFNVLLDALLDERPDLRVG